MSDSKKRSLVQLNMEFFNDSLKSNYEEPISSMYVESCDVYRYKKGGSIERSNLLPKKVVDTNSMHPAGLCGDIADDANFNSVHCLRVGTSNNTVSHIVSNIATQCLLDSFGQIRTCLGLSLEQNKTDDVLGPVLENHDIRLVFKAPETIMAYLLMDSIPSLVKLFDGSEILEPDPLLMEELYSDLTYDLDFENGRFYELSNINVVYEIAKNEDGDFYQRFFFVDAHDHNEFFYKLTSEFIPIDFFERLACQPITVRTSSTISSDMLRFLTRVN